MDMTLQTSQNLRIVPVLGDNMLPRLRPRRDFVMVAVGSGYQYGAVYAVDFGDGASLYRCERRIGSGQIELWSDNPAYGVRDLVDLADFEAVCVGVVVGELIVEDAHLLK
ncbi:MAG: S24 family peptidase, partial [Caulobacteraceae bacterium]|nr:S24 family peptidase [Caulobacteraceae bacterium]